MPPFLAFLLTIAFVVFLYRRDIREKPEITAASWLPLIWLLLTATRSAFQWLYTFGWAVGDSSLEEGTPLDAFVFLVLISTGLLVLARRRVSLEKVVRNNGWVAVYLAYCFISISWSDFPLVSFKHWIKVVGHPIMVLILLTEPDPIEAVVRLFKRFGYVFVPFSILVIKYYLPIGRQYDPWTGAQAMNGIALDKNMLGIGCLILGCFFVWNLLKTLPLVKSKARRDELILTVGFLCMVGWLFRQANSATSLISFLLCLLVMIVTKLPFVNKRAMGVYAIIGVLALAMAQLTFGIFGQIVDVSGHESTFEGRGRMWQELLRFDINPLIGTGFESFWLGDRLRKLWAEYWFHPNEAHNGYLETYLNLGILGLMLLGGLLVSAFRKASRMLSKGDEFGRFQWGFLAGLLVYNWTEAGFRGLDPVWFVFFIVVMQYPAVVHPIPVSTSVMPATMAVDDAQAAEFANCGEET